MQVVLEDGSLYNGYMLTKEVSPDGISGLLVAGISIIIALVTIVLSIGVQRMVKKNAIIIDTCGVKNEVFDGLRDSLSGKDVRFVGGHPMAGIERSGFDYAFETLFE